MTKRGTSFDPRKRALTIAGFDPSGGAGVLADLRTFAAFGFQGLAVVTSLTFQNPSRVVGAVHQSAETVRAQVLPLLDEFRIACCKTGMLPKREVVLEVVRLFEETGLPRPVVDPVMQSSSGERLMEDDALNVLIEKLLPLAQVITPNIPEAETITGIVITSENDMRRAAAMIRGLGAAAVLIKGGHLAGQSPVGSRQPAGAIAQGASDEAIDLLDNEGKVTVFREHRISGELHGSGCILSAGIAAGLGNDRSLEDSVSAAKSFVSEAIQNSRMEKSKLINDK